ncbi:MAG: orotate phosphoribosyltransferase [Candidatus Aegiribacteria sp.]|nr:orotate phosphoribosyltransferase [Candidatus Aegiribacteria sp.]MBD3294818.1 orotate phosphoribosyltransferase [Candidatus Fermentibacteria bacterium]
MGGNVTEERVARILKECDALLEGHFSYTSGRHGGQYFEKIRIVSDPAYVDELGKMMAKTMEDLSTEIDLVCAPAHGAVVFGFSTALHMGKMFAFLQRDSRSKMIVRSGFRDLVDGSRVLLVEDVSTTGGSILESIEALENSGAKVVQAGLIVDRTNGRLQLGVPYRALLGVDATSWDKEECPLCRDGVPLTTPGSSGKK